MRPLLGSVLALPLALAGGASAACDLALMLAVDVSGSVDVGEYRIQMDGLSAALRDPEITAALIASDARVSVIQWSGSGRQIVTVPWLRISVPDDLETLAVVIETMPRQWINYSTAIGEALILAAGTFDTVSDCARWVVDISGDGYSNEGIDPIEVRPVLEARGITVNALVIEESEVGLTDYFRAEVITGPGAFAVTARSFLDYPEQIRRKLLREISRPVAALEP